MRSAFLVCVCLFGLNALAVDVNVNGTKVNFGTKDEARSAMEEIRHAAINLPRAPKASSQLDVDTMVKIAAVKAKAQYEANQIKRAAQATK